MKLNELTKLEIAMGVSNTQRNFKQSTVALKMRLDALIYRNGLMQGRNIKFHQKSYYLSLKGKI